MPIKFNDKQSHSQQIERQMDNTFIDRNKIQFDAGKFVNRSFGQIQRLDIVCEPNMKNLKYRNNCFRQSVPIEQRLIDWQT